MNKCAINRQTPVRAAMRTGRNARCSGLDSTKPRSFQSFLKVTQGQKQNAGILKLPGNTRGNTIISWAVNTTNTHDTHGSVTDNK